MKIITQNKKAFFDYEILDRIEAGIVLSGDEVKSIRAGHISLLGSFAHIKDGELYLVNASITPYSKAYQKKDEEAARTRKLLIHRKELTRLIGDISKKGVTVIPLRVYLNERGLVKIDLGVCKHKKSVEKKQALKERDIKRETARELKNYR
jgi:SsrA-binding protein